MTAAAATPTSNLWGLVSPKTYIWGGAFWNTHQPISQWYTLQFHDNVIKWKHFSRYWPFVRGIHRSPVNSPHKDQWRGALMFSLICAWINGWVNNREAGDLRCYCAVIVMLVPVRQHAAVLTTIKSQSGASVWMSRAISSSWRTFFGPC